MNPNRIESNAPSRPAPAWLRATIALTRRMPFGRYRLLHWLRRLPVPPFISPIGACDARMTFHCDLRDAIASEVCFMGVYEPQETLVLRSILDPGKVFVDVGANWGYFTLIAASLVGDRGRVLSFEPQPSLHGMLQRNLLLNRQSQIAARQLAIAGEEGEMRLSGFSESNWGVSRLLGAGEEDPEAISVPVQRLERALANENIDHVDLLKIDVEGAEALILPTLKSDLDRRRFDWILVEFHPSALLDRKTSAEELIRLVLDRGYTAWVVKHDLDTSRRTAYGRVHRFQDILTRHTERTPLDSWPHILFCAPGVQALIESPAKASGARQ